VESVDYLLLNAHFGVAWAAPAGPQRTGIAVGARLRVPRDAVGTGRGGFYREPEHGHAFRRASIANAVKFSFSRAARLSTY